MMKFLDYFFKKNDFHFLAVISFVFFHSNIMMAAQGLPEHTDSVDIQPEKKEYIKKEALTAIGPRLLINRGMNLIEMNDTVNIRDLNRSGFLSVQQLLKGNVAGVYVQENSGEPGSIQSMMIRGLSTPVFSNKDVSGNQPVVYVNGVPVVQDHPYMYDFKQYDINPIGTATNILAGLDIQAIESIEIIKDPMALAKLGPMAVNGAILITTKDGFYGGKNISVNASAGMAFAPANIKMTNGVYEKDFRRQFFDAYNIPASDQYYPNYLSDQRELNYFGKPDWADSYYNTSPLYNAHVSIGSGNQIANYLFLLGFTGNEGIANDVGMNKYNIGFALNMTPLEGFTASTYINMSGTDRARNKHFRDRLAETEYLPDLSIPIAPAGGSYERYLDYHDLTNDDNMNNMLNGYLSLRYINRSFYSNAGLQFDYNTNTRHVFWPSSLMESVSFVSDYSGYNRRVIGYASAGYLFDFGTDHSLDIHWNGSLQSDYFHYNYNRGYDGDDDTKTTLASGSFAKMYRLSDKLESRLVSSSVGLEYDYKKLLYAGLLARYDGTSNVQLDHRWLFTPSFSLGWDMKKQFFATSPDLSKMVLKASWARLGRLVQSDRFASGPNYVSSEMAWNGQSLLYSANGYATVTRPYSLGWIGYDMGWPYSDKMSIDLSTSLFNNRINAEISFYENREKDLIIQIPVNQEFGYTSRFLNGMEVSNRGVDFNVSAIVMNSANNDRLNWDAAFNMNYNRNELKRLPEGLNEVEIQGRKLQVGKPIDAFWLYQNNGIYTDNSEVPIQDGKILSMNGIPFQAGDPRWTDVNHDNLIDSNDRVLTGCATPRFTGGLTNRLNYKQFDLSFHLFFALGHSALNIRDQQRYDFMTIDQENTLAAVKEITFWQKGINQKDDYPLYNPLSRLHPYRAEQDLFLEKLSYLKLRNVTFGYTQPMKRGRSKLLESIYFYLTVNNLFTITDFTGNDPELVSFDGYYNGYSIPIPRTASLGLRFNF